MWNLNFLVELDYELMYFFNNFISNSFFDQIMPWLRNDKFWVPLYIFLISFLLINFGKKSYWLILFAILSVSSSDMISSRLIKMNVQRDRPCRTELPYEVNVLVSCGSGHSFTSSHAANHFALAGFLSMTLGQYSRKIRWSLYVWAALICLAQVYVGVHFPFDVIAGAVLGLGLAWMWVSVYNFYYGNENKIFVR
ncbi:MAG: phosphatase PAP2 family protein [Saprospiraceae bacterium]|nr:phosphatase PAP2 family protein [Saprospiraceae bacterium]